MSEFYDENYGSEFIAHYGVKRRSGRYPWGSGEDPYQRSNDFMSRMDTLKKELTDAGEYSERALAEAMGCENTSELRILKAWAVNQRRCVEVAKAKDLRDKGFSLQQIADKMGYKNDSSVRSLLNADAEARMKQLTKTSDFLKKQIDEKGMIDVGVGVERELGVSKEKLEQALYLLYNDGYEVYGGRIPQATNPGKFTTLKVACRPGTPHSAIYNYGDIKSITDYTSHDGGETFQKYHYPSSMDSKRLAIRYAEDGGVDRDGVIELRRGVKDLSLGDAHYAQVRILVDGTHYLKGMAVYSDDLPDGVDVRFNTNKPRGTPPLGPKNNTVLKNIKDSKENPFGALIKANGQSYYEDGDGKQQLSLINRTKDEGDWAEWADRLPSQFLAKQNVSLIKKQLGIALADKKAEFDEINSLNNPTVKKSLLRSFADDCDSCAVHLNAAPLPGQKYQVILPVPSIGDKQIYAPNYPEGSEVALIRYPHGGIFEIPILTVNNKNREAKKFMNNAHDAVGISSTVAGQLSGADFDGDTVMVIPLGSGSNRLNISHSRPLDELKGFEPKLEYPYREGMKLMKNTQTEMGIVSNLITDMTIKGATPSELARAVKHSMVVIDAEKHRLNYTQSYIDNDIATLKKKYQSYVDPETGKVKSGGASTLMSRAKGKQVVTKRKGSPHINEKGKPWYDPTKPDGALIWNTVHEEYVGKDGKTHERTQDSTRMAETDDARTLSSGTRKEELYADYANSLKALANKSRDIVVHTGKIEYSAEAKHKYQAQVDSLNAKLDDALRNAPKERRAQIIANSAVDAEKQYNPNMSPKDIKKAKQMALEKARTQVGAKRVAIKVSDPEWEAIQAGAISESVLSKILNHADMDVIRQKAMPRTTTALTPAKISKIKQLYDLGYTTAQIADRMHISSSSVHNYLKEGVND